MVNTFDEYIKVYREFLLGNLTTENFHPLTYDLSNLAKNNLEEAFAVLSQVDTNALKIINSKLDEILFLKNKIKNVLSAGNKIFLCGCGATGRLSIVLESLFRQMHHDQNHKDQIVSFMAGGDVALIKSIESFEDNESFGQRQLRDLNFKEGDFLIASTEGGETTFVLAAAQEATKISSIGCLLVYCNNDIEIENLKRCSDALNNKKIQKLNLTCGPMALSGSTRMQATTVMMFALGLPLIYFNKSDEFLIKRMKSILISIENFDYSILAPLTELESDLYLKGQFITYQTTADIAVSVLTDTTERSPTFSLDPFENFNIDKHTAFCYLNLKGVNDSKLAWPMLLGRNPRCLNWPETGDIATIDRLYGFDISSAGFSKRQRKNHQHIFSIDNSSDGLVFELGSSIAVIDTSEYDLFQIHLLLKMLLNVHSTLIMGRLGRYEDNMMTWVKASNLKLIDRSIRYVKQLFKNRGVEVEYEIIAKRLFDQLPNVNPKNPIVLLTYNSLSRDYN